MKPAVLKHPVLVLVVYAALLMFTGVWFRDILTANEGQRSVPPMEMLESGDWIVPRLNGADYLKKPPFIYWEIAAVYTLIGRHEFAARLPSVLAGIALTVVVFWWVREFANQRAAFLAGLFTGANILILDKARQCELDMNLILLTFLTIWFWGRGIRRLDAGESGAAREFLIGGVWLALANLHKFPVPCLFVLPGVVGVAVWKRKWWWPVHPALVVAFVFSILPTLLWGLKAIEIVGWDRAAKVWFREAELRVDATEINSGPFIMYIFLCVTCFVPWSLFYGVFAKRDFRRSLAPNALVLAYIASAALVSVLILSFIPAKESEYMAPAAPLFCILLGLAADWWLDDPSIWPRVSFQRKWRILMTLALLFVAGFLSFRLYRDDRENDKRSPRAAGELVTRLRAAGEWVMVYGRMDPEMFFYSGIGMDRENGVEDLAEYLEARPDIIVLTRESRLEILDERFAGEYDLLYRDDYYAVLSFGD